MNPLLVIAFNTFRENLRDKILYNLLFFALLLIGGSVILADLTIAEQHKIVTDMGLAAISIIGVIIAIFLGVGLVSKEIERRTIYTVMARPISRVQFLFGKFLGLGLTIVINVLIMLVVFLATLWMTKAPIKGALLQAVQLIMVELLLVMAFALFFSTFTSSTLAAILTIAVFVIGHLTADLKGIAEKSNTDAVRAVMSGVYYLCPNLEAFNIKGQAAMGAPVTLSYEAVATVYGLLYVAALLVVACVIFQRRDF